MKTVIDIAHALAWLSAAVALLCVSYAVLALRIDATNVLNESHRALLEIALTAKNTREASDQWKQASQKEIEYFTETTYQARRALGAVGDLAHNTDAQLNGAVGILPTFRIAVAAQNENFGILTSQVGTSIKQVAANIQDTTAHTDELLSASAAIAGSPAIGESLQHVDASTANMQEATASVERSVKLIEVATARATKPAAWWKTIFTFVLDAGSKARILLYGGV